MATTNLKQTNFVISTNAAETEDGMYLDELWLLGWDNHTDWYTEIDSQDIMTPKGNVKKCEYNCMIQVNSHEAAYVSNTLDGCQSYCEDAIDEGYDCCICRLEKDDVGAIRIYKV